MAQQTKFRQIPRHFPYDPDGSPMALALHAAEDQSAEAYVVAYLGARLIAKFPDLFKHPHSGRPLRHSFGKRFVMKALIHDTMLEIEPVVEELLSIGWSIIDMEDGDSGRTIEFSRVEDPTFSDARLVLEAHPVAGASCRRVRDAAKDQLVRGYRWECEPLPGIEEEA